MTNPRLSDLIQMLSNVSHQHGDLPVIVATLEGDPHGVMHLGCMLDDEFVSIMRMGDDYAQSAN